jgi:hypothetical protein
VRHRPASVLLVPAVAGRGRRAAGPTSQPGDVHGELRGCRVGLNRGACRRAGGGGSYTAPPAQPARLLALLVRLLVLLGLLLVLPGLLLVLPGLGAVILGLVLVALLLSLLGLLVVLLGLFAVLLRLGVVIVGELLVLVAAVAGRDDDSAALSRRRHGRRRGGSRARQHAAGQNQRRHEPGYLPGAGAFTEGHRIASCRGFHGHPSVGASIRRWSRVSCAGLVNPTACSPACSTGDHARIASAGQLWRDVGCLFATPTGGPVNTRSSPPEGWAAGRLGTNT